MVYFICIRFSCNYPAPDSIGDRVLFTINFFVYFFVCLFIYFFVRNITRKWLDRFAWNFQGRCGVTMGCPDSILGQFGETVRCCDANFFFSICQHYERTDTPICMKFSGKMWSDHGMTWLHFWSILRNSEMPRCATRGGVCCAFASQLVLDCVCSN